MNAIYKKKIHIICQATIAMHVEWNEVKLILKKIKLNKNKLNLKNE